MTDKNKDKNRKFMCEEYLPICVAVQFYGFENKWDSRNGDKDQVKRCAGP
jgi:hypothetical protein